MNGEHKLNSNSYISLGLVLLLLSGGVWMNNKFNDLAGGQKDVGFKIEKVESRVGAIETAKVVNRWTNIDMFKWAVHLQRDNPQIKVPEPKHEE
jgi:hypothetical protein